MRTLYLAAGLAGDLSRNFSTGCRAVNVSPLLRELILHTIALGALDSAVPAHSRLIGILLDQLESILEIPLQLPRPVDERALRIANRLRDNPVDNSTLEHLAQSAGASARTIERLFRAETKMGFAEWRRRLRLLHALRQLAAGEPVTGVALDAGYDSTSAFIAMFRKHTGITPGRYYSKTERPRRP